MTARSACDDQFATGTDFEHHLVGLREIRAKCVDDMAARACKG
jgi:hypothetical protein